ncbi:MAG: hypothetical protein ABII27_03105, partial [bacterium]
MKVVKIRIPIKIIKKQFALSVALIHLFSSISFSSMSMFEPLYPEGYGKDIEKTDYFKPESVNKRIKSKQEFINNKNAIQKNALKYSNKIRKKIDKQHQENIAELKNTAQEIMKHIELIRQKRYKIYSQKEEFNYVKYSDGKKVWLKDGLVSSVEKEKLIDSFGNVSYQNKYNMQYNQKKLLSSYESEVVDYKNHKTEIFWSGAVYTDDSVFYASEDTKAAQKLVSFKEVIIDPQGNVTSRIRNASEYNENNLITAYTETIIDKYGNAEKKIWSGASYDSNKQLTGYNEVTVDCFGNKTTRTWYGAKYKLNPNYNPDDPYSRRQEYLLTEYHEDVVDTNGNVTSRDWYGGEYNENGLLVSYEESRIDELGLYSWVHWENGSYDTEGRLIGYTETTNDTFGYETEIFWKNAYYDAFGNLKGYEEDKKDPFGNLTFYKRYDSEFNSLGQIVAFKEDGTDVHGLTKKSEVTEIKYDAYNRKIKSEKISIDHFGEKTTEEFMGGVYDTQNRIIGFKQINTDSLNNTAINERVKTEYNKLGQVIYSNDRNTDNFGAVTYESLDDAEYDDFGRINSYRKNFIDQFSKKYSSERLETKYDSFGREISYAENSLSYDGVLSKIRWGGGQYNRKGLLTDYTVSVSKPGSVIVDVYHDIKYDENGRQISSSLSKDITNKYKKGDYILPEWSIWYNIPHEDQIKLLNGETIKKGNKEIFLLKTEEDIVKTENHQIENSNIKYDKHGRQTSSQEKALIYQDGEEIPYSSYIKTSVTQYADNNKAMLTYETKTEQFNDGKEKRTTKKWTAEGYNEKGLIDGFSNEEKTILKNAVGDEILSKENNTARTDMQYNIHGLLDNYSEMASDSSNSQKRYVKVKDIAYNDKYQMESSTTETTSKAEGYKITTTAKRTGITYDEAGRISSYRDKITDSETNVTEDVFCFGIIHDSSSEQITAQNHFTVKSGEDGADKLYQAELKQMSDMRYDKAGQMIGWDQTVLNSSKRDLENVSKIEQGYDIKGRQSFYKEDGVNNSVKGIGYNIEYSFLKDKIQYNAQGLPSSWHQMSQDNLGIDMITESIINVRYNKHGQYSFYLAVDQKYDSSRQRLGESHSLRKDKFNYNKLGQAEGWRQISSDSSSPDLQTIVNVTVVYHINGLQRSQKQKGKKISVTGAGYSESIGTATTNCKYDNYGQMVSWDESSWSSKAPDLHTTEQIFVAYNSQGQRIKHVRDGVHQSNVDGQLNAEYRITRTNIQYNDLGQEINYQLEELSSQEPDAVAKKDVSLEYYYNGQIKNNIQHIRNASLDGSILNNEQYLAKTEIQYDRYGHEIGYNKEEINSSAPDRNKQSKVNIGYSDNGQMVSYLEDGNESGINGAKYERDYIIKKTNCEYNSLGQMIAWMDETNDSDAPEFTTKTVCVAEYNANGQQRSVIEKLHKFGTDGDETIDVREENRREDISYNTLGQTIGYKQTKWSDAAPGVTDEIQVSISYDQQGRQSSYDQDGKHLDSNDNVMYTYRYTRDNIIYNNFGLMEHATDTNWDSNSADAITKITLDIEYNSACQVISDHKDRLTISIHGNRVIKHITEDRKNIQHNRLGQILSYDNKEFDASVSDKEKVATVTMSYNTNGQMASYYEDGVEVGINGADLDKSYTISKTSCEYNTLGQMINWVDETNDSSASKLTTKTVCSAEYNANGQQQNIIERIHKYGIDGDEKINVREENRRENIVYNTFGQTVNYKQTKWSDAAPDTKDEIQVSIKYDGKGRQSSYDQDGKHLDANDNVMYTYRCTRGDIEYNDLGFMEHAKETSWDSNAPDAITNTTLDVTYDSAGREISSSKDKLTTNINGTRVIKHVKEDHTNIQHNALGQITSYDKKEHDASAPDKEKVATVIMSYNTNGQMASYYEDGVEVGINGADLDNSYTINKTNCEYNSLGQMINWVDETNDSSASKLTTSTVCIAEYDANGQQQSVIEKIHKFGTDGNETIDVHEENRRENIVYNTFGQTVNYKQTKWSDAAPAVKDQIQVSITYDEKGRQESYDQDGKHLDADGSVMYTYEYTKDDINYNNLGFAENWDEKSWNSSSSELITNTYVEVDYSDNGQIVSEYRDIKETSKDGISLNRQKRTDKTKIDYNNLGQVISQSISESVSGSTDLTTSMDVTITYDEKGRDLNYAIDNGIESGKYTEESIESLKSELLEVINDATNSPESIEAAKKLLEKIETGGIKPGDGYKKEFTDHTKNKVYNNKGENVSYDQEKTDSTLGPLTITNHVEQEFYQNGQKMNITEIGTEVPKENSSQIPANFTNIKSNMKYDTYGNLVGYNSKSEHDKNGKLITESEVKLIYDSNGRQKGSEATVIRSGTYTESMVKELTLKLKEFLSSSESGSDDAEAAERMLDMINNGEIKSGDHFSEKETEKSENLIYDSLGRVLISGKTQTNSEAPQLTHYTVTTQVYDNNNLTSYEYQYQTKMQTVDSAYIDQLVIRLKEALNNAVDENQRNIINDKLNSIKTGEIAPGSVFKYSSIIEKLNFEYDKFNRVIKYESKEKSTDTNPLTTTKIVEMDYDNLGRVIQLREDNEIVAQYDDANIQVAQSWANEVISDPGSTDDEKNAAKVLLENINSSMDGSAVYKAASNNKINYLMFDGFGRSVIEQEAIKTLNPLQNDKIIKTTNRVQLSVYGNNNKQSDVYSIVNEYDPNKNELLRAYKQHKTIQKYDSSGRIARQNVTTREGDLITVESDTADRMYDATGKSQLMYSDVRVSEQDISGGGAVYNKSYNKQFNAFEPNAYNNCGLLSQYTQITYSDTAAPDKVSVLQIKQSYDGQGRAVVVHTASNESERRINESASDLNGDGVVYDMSRKTTRISTSIDALGRVSDYLVYDYASIDNLNQGIAEIDTNLDDQLKRIEDEIASITSDLSAVQQEASKKLEDLIEKLDNEVIELFSSLNQIKSFEPYSADLNNYDILFYGSSEESQEYQDILTATIQSITIRYQFDPNVFIKLSLTKLLKKVESFIVEKGEILLFTDDQLSQDTISKLSNSRNDLVSQSESDKSELKQRISEIISEGATLKVNNIEYDKTGNMLSQNTYDIENHIQTTYKNQTYNYLGQKISAEISTKQINGTVETTQNINSDYTYNINGQLILDRSRTVSEVQSADGDKQTEEFIKVTENSTFDTLGFVISSKNTRINKSQTEFGLDEPQLVQEISELALKELIEMLEDNSIEADRESVITLIPGEQEKELFADLFQIGLSYEDQDSEKTGTNIYMNSNIQSFYIIEEGDAKLSKGDFRNALKLYQDALQLMNKNMNMKDSKYALTAMSRIAVAAFLAKDFTAAEEAAQNMLEVIKNKSNYLQNDRFLDSFAQVRKIIPDKYNFDQFSFASNILLGRIKELTGNSFKAQNYYMAALSNIDLLEDTKFNVELVNNLIFQTVNIKINNLKPYELRDQIHVIENMINRLPFPKRNEVLGDMYYKIGWYVSADSYFKKALDNEPGNYKVLKKLALSQFKSEDFSLALGNIKNYILIKGDDIEAKALYSYCLAKTDGVFSKEASNVMQKIFTEIAKTLPKKQYAEIKALMDLANEVVIVENIQNLSSAVSKLDLLLPKYSDSSNIKQIKSKLTRLVGSKTISQYNESFFYKDTKFSDYKNASDLLNATKVFADSTEKTNYILKKSGDNTVLQLGKLKYEDISITRDSQGRIKETHSDITELGTGLEHSYKLNTVYSSYSSLNQANKIYTAIYDDTQAPGRRIEQTTDTDYFGRSLYTEEFTKDSISLDILSSSKKFTLDFNEAGYINKSLNIRNELSAADKTIYELTNSTEYDSHGNIVGSSADVVELGAGLLHSYTMNITNTSFNSNNQITGQIVEILNDNSAKDRKQRYSKTDMKYDIQGNLDTYKETGENYSVQRHFTQYDAYGRILNFSESRGWENHESGITGLDNSWNSGSASVDVSYNYDSSGRISNLEVNAQGNGNHDTQGNRGILLNYTAYNYQYNQLGQVLSYDSTDSQFRERTESRKVREKWYKRKKTETYTVFDRTTEDKETSMSYDFLGRVSESTGESSQRVTGNYNKTHETDIVYDSKGNKISANVESDGNLNTREFGATFSSSKKYNYTYDESGNLARTDTEAIYRDSQNISSGSSKNFFNTDLWQALKIIRSVVIGIVTGGNPYALAAVAAFDNAIELYALGGTTEQILRGSLIAASVELVSGGVTKGTGSSGKASAGGEIAKKSVNQSFKEGFKKLLSWEGAFIISKSVGMYFGLREVSKIVNKRSGSTTATVWSTVLGSIVNTALKFVPKDRDGASKIIYRSLRKTTLLVSFRVAVNEYYNRQIEKGARISSLLHGTQQILDAFLTTVEGWDIKSAVNELKTKLVMKLKTVSQGFRRFFISKTLNKKISRMRESGEKENLKLGEKIKSKLDSKESSNYLIKECIVRSAKNYNKGDYEQSEKYYDIYNIACAISTTEEIHSLMGDLQQFLAQEQSEDKEVGEFETFYVSLEKELENILSKDKITEKDVQQLVNVAQQLVEQTIKFVENSLEQSSLNSKNSKLVKKSMRKIAKEVSEKIGKRENPAKTLKLLRDFMRIVTSTGLLSELVNLSENIDFETGMLMAESFELSISSELAEVIKFLKNISDEDKDLIELKDLTEYLSKILDKAAELEPDKGQYTMLLFDKGIHVGIVWEGTVSEYRSLFGTEIPNHSKHIGDNKFACIVTKEQFGLVSNPEIKDLFDEYTQLKQQIKGYDNNLNPILEYLPNQTEKMNLFGQNITVGTDKTGKIYANGQLKIPFTSGPADFNLTNLMIKGNNAVLYGMATIAGHESVTVTLPKQGDGSGAASETSFNPGVNASEGKIEQLDSEHYRISEGKFALALTVDLNKKAGMESIDEAELLLKPGMRLRPIGNITIYEQQLNEADGVYILYSGLGFLSIEKITNDEIKNIMQLDSLEEKLMELIGHEGLVSNEKAKLFAAIGDSIKQNRLLSNNTIDSLYSDVFNDSAAGDFYKSLLVAQAIGELFRLVDGLVMADHVEVYGNGVLGEENLPEQFVEHFKKGLAYFSDNQVQQHFADRGEVIYEFCKELTIRSSADITRALVELAKYTQDSNKLLKDTRKNYIKLMFMAEHKKSLQEKKVLNSIKGLIIRKQAYVNDLKEKTERLLPWSGTARNVVEIATHANPVGALEWNFNAVRSLITGKKSSETIESCMLGFIDSKLSLQEEAYASLDAYDKIFDDAFIAKLGNTLGEQFVENAAFRLKESLESLTAFDQAVNVAERFAFDTALVIGTAGASLVLQSALRSVEGAQLTGRAMRTFFGVAGRSSASKIMHITGALGSGAIEAFGAKLQYGDAFSARDFTEHMLRGGLHYLSLSKILGSFAGFSKLNLAGSIDKAPLLFKERGLSWMQNIGKQSLLMSEDAVVFMRNYSQQGVMFSAIERGFDFVFNPGGNLQMLQDGGIKGFIKQQTGRFLSGFNRGARLGMFFYVAQAPAIVYSGSNIFSVIMVKLAKYAEKHPLQHMGLIIGVPLGVERFFHIIGFPDGFSHIVGMGLILAMPRSRMGDINGKMRQDYVHASKIEQFKRVSSENNSFIDLKVQGEPGLVRIYAKGGWRKITQAEGGVVEGVVVMQDLTEGLMQNKGYAPEIAKIEEFAANTYKERYVKSAQEESMLAKKINTAKVKEAELAKSIADDTIQLNKIDRDILTDLEKVRQTNERIMQSDKEISQQESSIKKYDNRITKLETNTKNIDDKIATVEGTINQYDGIIKRLEEQRDKGLLTDVGRRTYKRIRKASQEESEKLEGFRAAKSRSHRELEGLKTTREGLKATRETLMEPRSSDQGELEGLKAKIQGKIEAAESIRGSRAGKSEAAAGIRDTLAGDEAARGRLGAARERGKRDYREAARELSEGESGNARIYKEQIADVEQFEERIERALAGGT